MKNPALAVLYEPEDSGEALIQEWMGDMDDYNPPAYSWQEVRDAGKAIARHIVWAEQERPAILETFKVVNNWRDAHLLPMRHFHMSLEARIRHLGVDGFTASRAKRMSSIRKKLRRTSIKLDRIQDLAGCRAIMADIDGVDALVQNCFEGMRHSVRKHDDYITDKPKPNGYRGHHVIWEYQGTGDKLAFDGLAVEMQIRTQLQHSWATAVEAVGLLRDEDLKADEGSPEWLRLFALMSAEFASEEGCPIPDGLPGHNARIAEIRQLSRTLDAIDTLEHVKIATRHVQTQVRGDDTARFFMLVYDGANGTVSVSPFTNTATSSSALHSMELELAERHDGRKVVLVEVARMERLADAYPNYFGDVNVFIHKLRHLSGDVAGQNIRLQTQPTVPPTPKGIPDLSWFKRRHRW